MHSLRRESASLGDIAPMSRARIRWYSSSQPELSAIRRNRANSLSLSWRLPSTMFAGMDIAARIIWPRSDWSCDRRIPVATRCVCTASACAFRQTCSFLKSLTPNGALESLNDVHRFIPAVVSSLSLQRESVCLPGTPPEELLAKQLQSLQLPAWVLWVHLSTAISPDVLCYVSSIITKRKDNGGDLDRRRPRSFRRRGPR